ncbi:hypothetical protein [Nocardioides sp.]|uniref:hypothetical protein n=1 Tax=Nocardioides sp. TaxID=35761 RepID=UPI00260DAD22|nr:hypothetical protein [Nocardioides sp.]
MALTRRTERFGDLARATEDQLREHGLQLDGAVVDQILRNRIDAVAEAMRVTPRTALNYAPDNLPVILADTITEASQALPPTMPCGSRRPDLRIVK